MDGGAGGITLPKYLIPLKNLKMAKMVNLMLCVFMGIANIKNGPTEQIWSFTERSSLEKCIWVSPTSQ